MKTWKDLLELLSAGLGILFFDDLGVVLQNVGQPARGKQFLPKVGCLQSIRVRWIPSTVVVTSVKGQEPRRLAFQFRTHHRLAIINSEMDNAATKPK